MPARCDKNIVWSPFEMSAADPGIALSFDTDEDRGIRRQVAFARETFRQ